MKKRSHTNIWIDGGTNFIDFIEGKGWVDFIEEKEKYKGNNGPLKIFG